MADHSAIEWTDATWNPVRGCTRVSEGCRNCYVDEFAFRLNEGNVRRHTMERLDSMVLGTVGKRITYKELIQ